jgi:sigma-E factor negative regulatory protein RseB
MFRRPLLLCVLICFPAVTSAVETQQEAYKWLEKMHVAVQQLNYEGTFVYLHNQHMESMKIVHTVEDGIERERLVSLNGARREVVRSKGEVICIQPDIKSVLVGKRFGHEGIANILPYDPDKISSYYDFRISGEERIADKNTKIILVIPKDENRYGHRVSIDMESALPLRSDLLDNSGKTISQIMFTSMVTGSNISSNALELVTHEELKEYNWKHQNPIQNNDASKVDTKWTFEAIPEGFRLSVHETRAGSNNSVVEHFVFTDGLATMSVYIEKAMAEKQFDGGSHMGAIHAFGTQLEGYQITAVGEVPAQTVKKFALSAKYSKQE